ncbi:MAG: activator of (R)-2-hydroxyglutaryl-CoA dehydratase [Acidobacteria bacterium]|nr:activator of (R)-2-hydroxyglutaryl-CoA dehydratase [Acidobacteriota bacterium]
MEAAVASHFAKPVERPFTRAERDTTTILFGGLTWKHERLVQGALEGLGYHCAPVPTADVRAFQTGKEYGNNGQCNPTYFTVGNLVQFLQGLEAKGMTRQEIIDKYVFFTAGACGPCRFGMYEAEYRLALRNSGFDGFRVLLFQQGGGLNQADVDAGLEMDLDFFLGILNALNMGDVINEVVYQIRPYEVNKGETNRVLEECMEYMRGVIRRHRPFDLREKSRTLSRLFGNGGQVGKFLNQLTTDEYTAALRHVRDRLNAIPVDRTRTKPIVKITGEFWAQTTEGDGNFNMFAFLEREGAEVLVEPIGTWIMYMIHQFKQKIADRAGVEEGQTPPPSWRLDQRAKIALALRKRLARMTVAEKIFEREYNRIREALGGTAHGLVNQYELQRLGHPYYNSRSGGGEGHLEVAKNIYYHNKDLAHMVLSLKPFGCMPSTQSDGAQSAVISHFKDMIYLPIETSGEGEINAHSRVQMALGEAKSKAKGEFQTAVESTGYDLDQIRTYVKEHAELQRPILHLPHYRGVIGTAARFVKHAGELMRKEGVPATRSVQIQTPLMAAH